MDPEEVARLQAVEDAARALLARPGHITRAALQAAVDTPAPPTDLFEDAVFDPTVFG